MSAAARRQDRPEARGGPINEPMTEAEFDRLFHDVSNWGRWGPKDERGTLNYLTPDRVRSAAALVRSGRSVSMSRPIDTVAAVDNPNPAIHHMLQSYDIPAAAGEPQFVSDYLGCGCHGNAHSHVDALCHVAYKGRLYNNRPTSLVDSHGAHAMDITTYAHGIVGRGVLLDIPRLRGTVWLEPGDAVTAEELQAAEKAQGVRLGEGDLFVFRVGIPLRRKELGPWNTDHGGEGRPGLHPGAMRLLHERKVAAFLPDGDGETIPSAVEGVIHPVHALQIGAMGLACGDSLQLEDLARVCEEEGRWEFMVAMAPLRLPRGTGSLVNPIAIF
ncbi:MAG: cyclase family protein [Nitrososphaerales archaeon]